MIDFEKTRDAIYNSRKGMPRDHRRDDQVSAVMMNLCNEVLEGRLTAFSETDSDAFSRSFIVYCQDRGLLATA